MEQAAVSSLGLPEKSYIYRLVTTCPKGQASALAPIAAIASDDSLRIFDPSSLKLTSSGVISKVHESVTCLERVDDPGNVLATAGRDGLVRFWDHRTGEKAIELKSPNGQAISSITCSFENNVTVAGTELEGNGPGDAPMFLWDTRKPSSPHLQLLESHTDTITQLQLHPTKPSILLSGSTDGLVNIFDITQATEEDALRQVINHRSAIHHTGFLNETNIYALGIDETLSFYQLQNDDESVQEPSPNHYGDVREKFGCEYVIGLTWMGPNAYISAGSYSSQRLDIIPLYPPASPDSSGSMDVDEKPLDWVCGLDKRIRLGGGHGEEVVRDVIYDTMGSRAFTCGEDGLVKLWKSNDTIPITSPIDELTSAKSSSSGKLGKEKRKKGEGQDSKKRFKPY